ncbi:MAG TPA: hypothetical protein VFJ84_03390 [Candidatus Saccharimonadales bacterium]|nr:hypothetical protein [Candidatus Saccharimonadales bacterium]
MKTAALIEGFSGGPMHTRQFRSELEKAGYKVIRNRRRADIIIAHSAGIYAVPDDARAHLIMLIGPTYWPGQPLLKRVMRHTKTSRRHYVANFGWGYYLWKKLLEFYYFFRRHNYMWLGILNNNKLAHLQKLMDRPDQKTIVIRNHSDPFTSPGIKDLIKGPGVRYFELPGVHDDYVKNARPYIDIIKKEMP